MDDFRKTKTELAAEVARLRLQVAELQGREAARRSMETALQAAKEYADTLINSSLDMIISVDVNRKIMEFNAAAERSFGYRRAEVLGQSVDLLYAEAVTGLQVHDRMLHEGKFTGEVLNRRKNGEVFYSYLSASPMRSAEGALLGFMGISRDISDRKQLEQQRAEFLAMLTHDIKKPLGAILACTEIVLEGVKAHHLTEEEELLERLRSSVTTIDSLVSNYLDFSRIEAGSLALVRMPLQVDRVLQRVRQQYEAEARRRNLRLEVVTTPEALEVAGDLLALERVFANLVHNALKFTPAGGAIRVQAAPRQGYAVITVKDTGPGVAPEERTFLFEKYRRPTPRRQREGTGLGLAIVKALVEAHQGRVEVESLPGHGACFIVSLPLLAPIRQ
ncbi:MAG TPA: PAS domain-containing sensor histidine kinase [Methylomirabilota bacterium]|nr:PAS domain-containing sensor histidine kinase [Methylomirabilota bacterium]